MIKWFVILVSVLFLFFVNVEGVEVFIIIINFDGL